MEGATGEALRPCLIIKVHSRQNKQEITLMLFVFPKHQCMKLIVLLTVNKQIALVYWGLKGLNEMKTVLIQRQPGRRVPNDTHTQQALSLN